MCIGTNRWGLHPHWCWLNTRYWWLCLSEYDTLLVHPIYSAPDTILAPYQRESLIYPTRPLKRNFVGVCSSCWRMRLCDAGPVRIVSSVFSTPWHLQYLRTWTEGVAEEDKRDRRNTGGRDVIVEESGAGLENWRLPSLSSNYLLHVSLRQLGLWCDMWKCRVQSHYIAGIFLLV